MKHVCTQMGVKTNSIFNVCVLNEEEAKTLFFECVELLDGDDPDLQNIGENIVEMCGGLPIAIVTIARVLSGNIKDAWKETLSNLQNHDLQDLGKITDTIFELSYNNLEREDDRAIFLLSGLFPEDSDISIEDLTIYGWGLKLFTKVHTLAQARRRATICVNNLIHANLLTKSQSMGSAKIHDLTRAFVLSNFSKVIQASLVMHDNKSGMRHIEGTHDTYERILLKNTGMSKFPEDFTNFDNLSLLILMDGDYSLDYPKDLHKRMENLEVVSYEGMHIPLLPTTFIHSTKLRTLCFHSCNLIQDHIYVIGSLSNLETLSFAYSALSMLPSAIGKLEKLKLLDLTGCVNLCIEDDVFRNLVSLEELYMRASLGKPIRFTNANYNELHIILENLSALELEFVEENPHSRYVSFKNLRRFKISIGRELRDNERTSFSNTLDIVADNNELQDSNIRELFEETEELSLQVNDMIHLQDVSMDHTFSQLRVLYVFNCAELTHLFTFEVASGLKKLERLTIIECPNLITLVGDGKRGVIRFPKLEFMALEYVPNMVSLCDDKIELPEMAELRLDGLSKITHIYPDKNYDDNVCVMQSLLNKEVVIPRLETLYISRMEKLRQIWPCQISTGEKKNVSMLKEINIQYCDSLVNLFPSNPIPLLNHLEEIRVANCDSVEVLFNIDLERVHEMEGYSSRLRRINVSFSRNLKELWRMRGGDNSEILINTFKSVESIKIIYCERFANLFTPITTNFDLEALTQYSTDTVSKEIDDMEIKVPRLTYPSYLLRTSHHLQCLELNRDNRVVEVVFEMDSPISSRLPYLEVLRLEYLFEMSHVWKCNNWNAFLLNPQHQPQLLQLQPFQNLTEIHLMDCHKLKYLFSPLMAIYLSNLKKVVIRFCDGIEEVISSRDDQNEGTITSTSTHQNMATFFPHLDTLNLRCLSGLKSVDDQFQSFQVSTGASWSFCQYPKRIVISECDALASLVPWYAVGQMKRLQELEIFRCSSIMSLFQSETNTTTESITNVVIVVPQLSNLKILSISKCQLLPHIFTFSTLESLKQLTTLKVKRCEAVHVIVKEENEASSKGVKVFPRLKTLELDDLPNLKGFFLGVNEFSWPSLDDVMIKDCPQLMVFTSGQSKTRKLKYILSTMGKQSLDSYGLNSQTTFPTSSSSGAPTSIQSWPFNNLIEIHRVGNDVRSVIPYHALLQLQKLEKIQFSCSYEVEEVFQVQELEAARKNHSGINESQTTVVKIPNLTQVDVHSLYCLKYLWKSTNWLVLEFPNLTTVDIRSCDNLEHVFTCSMVGSLVQLQDLCIIDCENIEVIVKEEEKKECGDKVNEIMIMLPRLKSVTLDDLPRLKGFCLGKEAFSLPSLDTLEIKDCPEITVFTNGSLSTPELEKCYMTPDLNSFIKTKQEEGVYILTPEQEDDGV